VFWDFTYQHCSYFTQSSLAKLFTMSAFRIRDIQESFGSQFLAVEASAPSDGKATTFLNIVDPAGSPISHIIDIIPASSGS
jgi:hypothetical protein